MRHVLVCDDDGAICAMLRDALGEGGYRVTCCERGGEALDILAGFVIDFALVDVVLPDVSGLAVARAAMHRGAVVLLMSGHPKECHRLEEAGCPVLQKPFRLSDLLGRIVALLLDATEHQRRMTAALHAVD